MLSYARRMAKKTPDKGRSDVPVGQDARQRVPTGEKETLRASASPRLKPSALVDTRVIYCGDTLEQLKKLFDRTRRHRFPAPRLERSNAAFT